MTISITPEMEARLSGEAARRGVDVNECARQLIEESLSKRNDATLELLRTWNEEEAADDPEEIARAQRESEEFMQNLARNRIEMEGPNARKLWP